MDPVLEVKKLSVTFRSDEGRVRAVDDVSFAVGAGRTLGIVGESGSGKSVSTKALMRLLPRSAELGADTRMRYRAKDGRLLDIETIPENSVRMRHLRGGEMGMIFQEPMASFSPVYTIGAHMVESIRLHRGLSRRAARAAAIDMLREVGIANPESRIDAYAFELSGGMRQRAMIALALSAEPQLLIADEPTTALDVTVQAQILDLLQDLQREFNSAVIIITHDLGVIAEMADDILVMYGGRGVEKGPAKEVLTRPQMPYTWGLLSSVPDVHGDTASKLVPIPGNPPSLLDPPSGCAFHPRCAHVDKVAGNKCVTELPPLTAGPTGAGHLNRCHLADPVGVFETEVLPVIAPELLEES